MIVWSAPCPAQPWSGHWHQGPCEMQISRLHPDYVGQKKDYTLTICTFVVIVGIFVIVIIIIIAESKYSWFTGYKFLLPLALHVWGADTCIVLSSPSKNEYVSRKGAAANRCIVRLSIIISVWSDMSECIISVSSGWTRWTIRGMTWSVLKIHTGLHMIICLKYYENK